MKKDDLQKCKIAFCPVCPSDKHIFGKMYLASYIKLQLLVRSLSASYQTSLHFSNAVLWQVTRTEEAATEKTTFI